LYPESTPLEDTEKTMGAHNHPGAPKVRQLHHKKQKASNPSAPQSSLELFKVTMTRILKLKTQMQEKQVAVLNVKRQTQKGNLKKIRKMEQELQDLQSQLCAEQAQQQARVEQLERTLQEEEHHLQVPPGGKARVPLGRAGSLQTLARTVSFWTGDYMVSTKDRRGNGSRG
jgi:E3 ubiquitin-protein ligase RNF8